MKYHHVINQLDPPFVQLLFPRMSFLTQTYLLIIILEYLPLIIIQCIIFYDIFQKLLLLKKL